MESVGRDAKCLFCRILAGEVDSVGIYEDDATYVFLDVRPVFPGHCLLVPKRHVHTLPDLADSELSPLLATARRLAAVMPDALDAQGTFVGINNVVSQSVPHLHVHVIPRRFKDGLRGFLWPRHKYGSDDEMLRYARALRDALDSRPDRDSA